MIKILKYDEVQRSRIFTRESCTDSVSGVVSAIIDDVRNNGDSAILKYTKKFDRAYVKSLEVSADELDEAFSSVSTSFIDILNKAAENIRRFHEKQVRSGFTIAEKNGVIVGQRIIPIERVGLYVPGGTAAYPSTVLMDSIPAKIAGCPELVMVTPPMTDGSVNPLILAAAVIGGVDRVFKCGGAQAIAALAYGTESIPRVDKIVGPGNAYVAEAKKQVFGRVSIDMIAGPSEILVISDASCSASVIAADLLSQAEHDRMASAVLITDSYPFASEVASEIEKQLELLPRREIARASIDNNGKIIVVSDLHTAIDVANEIAPEHLELCVNEPFNYLSDVRNAGSVFLGNNCPEALGDYYAGPNHTLPTGGSARFSSPLSVDDFVKKSQYIYFSESALREVAGDVAAFAEKEGLSAHARSILTRFRGDM